MHLVIILVCLILSLCFPLQSLLQRFSLFYSVSMVLKREVFRGAKSRHGRGVRSKVRSGHVEPAVVHLSEQGED